MHVLVTAEGNVEDDNMIVEIASTVWDGEVGSWLTPCGRIHIARAGVLPRQRTWYKSLSVA